MDILVSGASGLIGTMLVPSLASDGHRVVKLSRSLAGAGVKATWNPAANQIDLSRAEPLDAVVHLAGETIGQRWTAKVKRRVRESRVNGTRLLCESLVRLPQPPKVLVCASATGFYGDRGDEWLDETSAPGTGFLADVSREWEAAAAPAVKRRVRVVHLRFGIVLTPNGGALTKMLPAFKLGVGGMLGDGKQYWSWITLEDAVSAIRYALACEKLSGPINAVAPNPATNLEFTKTLGRVLHRPTICGIPHFAVELLFGEMGREALLASFRVTPARLIESGFRFRYPELEPALRHMLGAFAGEPRSS